MDENKKKITLEYAVNCTVASLYAKLSTEEGLETWFADKVKRNVGGIFVFYWHKEPQEAELVSSKENKYVRFRWLDEAPDSFFELRIDQQDLTGDVGLFITDFSETNEYEDAVHMWEDSVKRLRRTLGCRS